jgi:transposase-like protein
MARGEGVRGRVFSPEEKKRIIAAHDNDMRLNEIAETWNAPKTAVRRVLVEAGRLRPPLRSLRELGTATQGSEPT